MRYFKRFYQGKYKGKSILGKIWFFIWQEDSVESWIINIILAFILIKYLVYPGLGFILSTSHPIVAVVSGSMMHEGNFGEWWGNTGSWYEEAGITQEMFLTFTMKNGFNKGDIMVLVGSSPNKVNVGDIIVFSGARVNPRPDPIIHRVVKKIDKNGEWIFQTKGDNYLTNPTSINGCQFRSGCLYESDIKESQIIGKAFIRVPYLGYVKIFAVEFACLFHDFNFCIR
ncbi:MAG: signal peptidase I [Candidatus Woesearchaeota archaeon]